ncbi:hypothetical protein E4U41_000354, partial [Claviceps citrina]
MASDLQESDLQGGFQSPTLAVVSGQAGPFLEAERLSTADYWVRQICKPVRSKAVKSLADALGMTQVTESSQLHGGEARKPIYRLPPTISDSFDDGQ